MSIIVVPFDIIDNFLNWVTDGWNIIVRIFFWCAQGFVWLTALLMIGAVYVMIQSLFWKNKDGHDMRMSCLVHILLIVVACFIAGAVKLCESSEQEKQIHGIMGNGKSEDDGVFICTGSHSTAYHLYSDCMGLGNCSGEIISISRDEAEEEGRHLCGFCKKR